MGIEECFIEYKNITLNIMEAVNSEKYEDLNEFFEQRQLVLNNINNLNCSKEEMKKLYIKSNIEQLEKTLEEEMKNKKNEILEKIKKSQKRKMAMNGYNNLQAKAVFLSKEL